MFEINHIQKALLETANVNPELLLIFKCTTAVAKIKKSFVSNLSPIILWVSEAGCYFIFLI
jgi:hypothetical protein